MAPSSATSSRWESVFESSPTHPRADSSAPPVNLRRTRLKGKRRPSRFRTLRSSHWTQEFARGHAPVGLKQRSNRIERVSPVNSKATRVNASTPLESPRAPAPALPCPNVKSRARSHQQDRSRWLRCSRRVDSSARRCLAGPMEVNRAISKTRRARASLILSRSSVAQNI